jgi:hypothetical protein
MMKMGSMGEEEGENLGGMNIKVNWRGKKKKTKKRGKETQKKKFQEAKV